MTTDRNKLLELLKSIRPNFGDVGSRDVDVAEQQRKIDEAIALLSAAQKQDSEHEFKNFHRALCERFDYCHDEVHWKRDQVSLEEHIASLLSAAQAERGPYAWLEKSASHDAWFLAYSKNPKAETKPLYLAPPSSDQVWKYCAECGCEEWHPTGYANGRFCDACGQEWFPDVDYTNVVKGHLGNRSLKRPSQAQEPADPMDWPLPCDITIGAGTIKKGCKLSALVARINVLHKMALERASASGAGDEPAPMTFAEHQRAWVLCPQIEDETRASMFDRIEAVISARDEQWRATLSRAKQAAQSAQVPEGWKLVPVKPDQAMCQAGQEKAQEWPRFPLRIAPIYQAMLAAAPQPDQGGDK